MTMTMSSLPQNSKRLPPPTSLIQTAPWDHRQHRFHRLLHSSSASISLAGQGKLWALAAEKLACSRSFGPNSQRLGPIPPRRQPSKTRTTMMMLRQVLQQHQRRRKSCWCADAQEGPAAQQEHWGH